MFTEDAQNEIGNLDVLICGKCHEAFHFIQQFQDHTSETCTGESSVRENYKHEPKPQVWAFMLWKNAQSKKGSSEDPTPTSWAIYQNWCKLSTKDKETWIAAGRNILAFTKISTAKVQEIKTKAQVSLLCWKVQTTYISSLFLCLTSRNVVRVNVFTNILHLFQLPNFRPIAPKPPTQEVSKESAEEDDALEEGEIRKSFVQYCWAATNGSWFLGLSELSEAQRVVLKVDPPVAKPISEVITNSDVDPLAGTEISGISTDSQISTEDKLEKSVSDASQKFVDSTEVGNFAEVEWRW